MAHLVKKHRTSNIEHRTPNWGRLAYFDVQSSVFDVRCSLTERQWDEAEQRQCVAAPKDRRVNRKSKFVNRNAFTLIEMVTVLALAVIIAAIILPSLRGFGEANTMGAATRQMLDDVGYARQTALKNHTKVYMVFVPPTFWTNFPSSDFSSLTQQSRVQAELLLKHQYTSYALFSFRSLGDQPGQGRARYLTKWRELPDGVIIETNKFFDQEDFRDVIDTNRFFDVRRFNYRRFPFPPSEVTNAVPKQAYLPYIAFDSTGALFTDSVNPPDVPDDPLATYPTEDELIPLARGSIFYPMDASGNPQIAPADVVETGYREFGRTNYNIIRIDRLTGRAKLEQPELR